jgi:hypothetical protein
VLFVVLFGALFSYEVAALFYRETGVPVAERGDRPRLIGEIAGDTVVAQTFVVGAGGLHAVTIEARPFGPDTAGAVEFALTDIGRADARRASVARPRDDASRPVARLVASAREVVAEERFRFEFPPVEDSKDRQYLLEIKALDAPAGRGIGVWATREQAYEGGILLVDGREQWGDLVFAAHAERATLFRRVEHMLADKPAWIRSRWTLGTLIVLYNWALAAFTWYMLFVEDETGDE